MDDLKCSVSKTIAASMRRADYIDAEIMRSLTEKTGFQTGSAIWCVLHVSHGNSDAEYKKLLKTIFGWRP